MTISKDMMEGKGKVKVKVNFGQVTVRDLLRVMDAPGEEC